MHARASRRLARARARTSLPLKVAVAATLAAVAIMALQSWSAGGGMWTADGASGGKTDASCASDKLFGVRAGASDGGIDGFVSAVGTRPNLVLDYSSFGEPFQQYMTRDAAAVGAIPYITWEPFAAPGASAESAFSLRDLASGQHDRYIRQWAAAARDSSTPVLLRFAHEMNGNWYPWSSGRAGNTPATYVAAWRHLRVLFAQEGADNVRWAWTPNVTSAEAVDPQPYYPGDDWVDWVGLDGYNRGSDLARWLSPSELFGPDLTRLQSFTNRPIFLSETASAESGGDKSAWIGDLFAWLRSNPQVRGLVWFNRVKEADWRVQSSGAAVRAFREGIVGLRPSTSCNANLLGPSRAVPSDDIGIPRRTAGPGGLGNVRARSYAGRGSHLET